MMLPPASQPAPRHWAGPTRRDTTGSGETILSRKERCPLHAQLHTVHSTGRALSTYLLRADYAFRLWRNEGIFTLLSRCIIALAPAGERNTTHAL
jgi:hypothetical protein